jgi:hypothetical protein
LVAILAIRDAKCIGQVDALAKGQLDAKGFLAQGFDQVKANNGKFLFELKEFPKLLGIHFFK